MKKTIGIFIALFVIAGLASTAFSKIYDLVDLPPR